MTAPNIKLFKKLDNDCVIIFNLIYINYNLLTEEADAKFLVISKNLVITL